MTYSFEQERRARFEAVVTAHRKAAAVALATFQAQLIVELRHRDCCTEAVEQILIDTYRENASPVSVGEASANYLRTDARVLAALFGESVTLLADELFKNADRQAAQADADGRLAHTLGLQRAAEVG